MTASSTPAPAPASPSWSQNTVGTPAGKLAARAATSSAGTGSHGCIRAGGAAVPDLTRLRGDACGDAVAAAAAVAEGQRLKRSASGEWRLVESHW